jgi:E3 ubiquitin-protein ligase UBR7
LRVNASTGAKGGVHSERPAPGNRYNQNFKNKFCGCEEEYDPHQEKGTMFQCLGLGTVEDGGCGEDWWHPECVLGIKREDFKRSVEANAQKKKEAKAQKDSLKDAALLPIQEESNGEGKANAEPPAQAAVDAEDDDDDTPLPPGFPYEDAFESFICYKCTDAFPWIKQYANSVDGFLPPVYYQEQAVSSAAPQNVKSPVGVDSTMSIVSNGHEVSRKRKTTDETMDAEGTDSAKRQKSEDPSDVLGKASADATTAQPPCKLKSLPPAPPGRFSLFFKEDFRDHLCRCASCFPILKKHPQLLEEEDTYEPPISEDEQGAPSVGTGSLLDRGEAAFSNMDRVRAIEGAMVYAHLKDKVKAFLQPFADSGKAVSADDIKTYFETLRGDSDAIRAARGGASDRRSSRDDENEGDGPDNRKEQSGK